MNVYIVIGYDSGCDGEEIRGVFCDEENAKLFKQEYGAMRIEEHEIADSSLAQGRME